MFHFTIPPSLGCCFDVLLTCSTPHTLESNYSLASLMACAVAAAISWSVPLGR